MKTFDSYLKWILLSLFLILLIGAVVYAQERILFCDASYIAFNILNLERLQIGEHRYGCFITQMVPLLGAKAGLSLSAIVVLYSASFNAFYFIVIALLLFKFKNYPLAILMSFYYTLVVSDTYFWTNNEVHQGIAWMFLFFALIIQYKHQKGYWWAHMLMFLILAVLSVFTHPLLLFIVPFLWLFINLDPNLRPYKRNEIIILSLVLLSVCVVKYLLMNRSGGYDAEKIRSATHFSIEDIFQSLTSPMVGTFLKRLLTHYYFIPIIFVAGIFSATRQKKYKQLILVGLFTIGYFVAMSLTYRDFVTFYIESEWMPFTIIISVLFVYYTIPSLKSSASLWIIVLILITRLIYIERASQKFTDRKDWLYAKLAEMREKNINKGYLYTGDGAVDSLLQMNWGVPTESIIASALYGDRPCRTFVVDKPEKIKQRMHAVTDRDMISDFGPWNGANLNATYFSIDTSAGYVPIESSAK